MTVSKTYEFPSAASDADLNALREQGYYQLDFWRQVPPPLWPALAQGDRFWMIQTIGAARGLEKPDTLSVMDTLTADELLALFRLATSGARVSVHYQNANKAATAFTALAKTSSEVIGLVESCDKTQGVPYLFAAFSGEQITQAKGACWSSTAEKTGDHYTDAAGAQARWFYLTQTDITAEEFAMLLQRRAGEIFSVFGTPDAKLLANLRRRLAAAVPQVRTWVAKQLDGWTSQFVDAHDFFPLWGAALEGPTDELVTRLGAMLDAKKDEFRKERDREKLATRFAQALVSRTDGHAILAALRKSTKAKALHAAYDAAGEQLTGMLGQAGKGPISWATLDPQEGAAVLAASPDARATVEEALASADANTALRVFQGLVWFVTDAHPTEPFGGVWPMASQVLATLERVLDDSTPAELVRDQFKTRVSTDDAFKYAMELLVAVLRNTRRAGGPKPEAEIFAELRAMHDASKNVRFRGLLAGILGESHGDKLARLAAACAGHKGGTVTRFFAERTDEAPGAGDISRLYGSPIGVSDEAWPRTKVQKQPMQHILTLETRVLSDEARSALGDAAAVAIFLADIDGPGGESAVVRLSAADLVKQHEPLVDPVIDGVRLAIRELALPTAVFQGGRKTGPLRELRVALDRLEGVLSTDRTSPRWIQEPEGAGALIAQLDESFAPRLNFGDNGAIYAMVGGVVFQCH